MRGWEGGGGGIKMSPVWKKIEKLTIGRGTIIRDSRVDDFEELFIPIAFCFEQISLNLGRVCNQDTKALSY